MLAAWIHIPEQIEKSEQKKQSLLGGTKEGWNYLMTNKGICYLVLSMTCANLFSRIGYENILPPLILARSNEQTLAFVTSVLLPFVNAGIIATMYENVPIDKQGRVFSIQNALQQGSVPIGILLGGYLADYVFEPFMRGTSPWVHFFERIVGTGTGNGMAVMFLFTGTFGALSTGVWYFTKEVRALENSKAE